MRDGSENAGRQITIEDDPRITWIGRWLRKYKIDEFPQLWNVLKGDMSIVGPRPEVPYYVSYYTPQQREVIQLTPGITDPASLLFRNESHLLANADDPEKLYVGSIMPEKLRLNLEYSRQASLLKDMKIILQTALKILR